ncbi:helix-turn-helix transcriptional regulator [Tardiphaga sp. 604_B6_N1_1]|uniref:helix-turn-helix transcriptional regulator n=1 Tax=Tardiphaga sp. 604_B6_N1_1 TaxID=3240779 RepID=UPI003F26B3C3
MSNSQFTFLRQPEVLRRTGHRKSTLNRLIQAGEFPKPVQISARAVGWREDLVDDWCGSRVEAREKASKCSAPARPLKRFRAEIERVRA